MFAFVSQARAVILFDNQFDADPNLALGDAPVGGDESEGVIGDGDAGDMYWRGHVRGGDAHGTVEEKDGIMTHRAGGNFQAHSVFSNNAFDVTNNLAVKVKSTWVVDEVASGSNTRGVYLALEDTTNKPENDAGNAQYVDFVGVFLQFDHGADAFELRVDDGDDDDSSTVVTSANYVESSWEDGFTAMLTVDTTGWELMFDGITWDGGAPDLSGDWADDGLDPADLFTADMHQGFGFTNSTSKRRLTMDSVTTEALPEPASLALLGLGGLLMMPRRRR